MDKKKILIVSAYFYPDITPRSFRTTELVKELSSRGYDVTLYIPYRNFDYTSFTEDYPVEIKFIKTKKLTPNLPKNNTFPARAFRFGYYKFAQFTEYPFIKLYYRIPKDLKGEKGYDLLISIAAPHSVHWGVAKCLKKNKQLAKKWIADCGDPFMGNKTRIKPKYFKYLEKMFCTTADFITVPVEEAKELYYPEFQNKIKVIPQGFDLSKRKLYKKTERHSIPTFAYAGVFYNNYRDPSEFFNLLSEVDEDFIFVLFTPKSNLTEKLLKKLGKRLIIKNFIPREELLKELSEMDFLVNFENRSKGQSPSKLIDYYMVNRPILSIPYNNFNKSIFYEFLNGNYQAQYNMENINDFDIKNVTEKFLTL